MARDLLLEIGTEELPWGAQEVGREQLAENALSLLRRGRLEHGPVEIFSTPRRLALLVRGLEERQADFEELVKGPSRSAAFDAEGRPTRAAEGFARSRGAGVEDLEVRETEKGEFVFLRLVQRGKPAGEVLPGLLDELLASFSFPKSMRWGSGEFRFARPVRWLVALYGGEVVPCGIEGLRSGRHTRGHRFLSGGLLELPDSPSYLESLRGACVLASREERQAAVLEQMERACRENGLKPVYPPELLEEVVDLVEWPHVLLGSFPDRYTDLPREILVTAMQEHQRYFPTEDQQGALSNRFVVVQNGDPAREEDIRRGNERVLKARLEDAEFFYREDGKLTLEERRESLKKVVYQARLGTYFDKVERLESLARGLAESAHLEGETARRACRAARLAKSDLVTAMVIEFPSLQGTVGRLYALRDGEEEATARAIEEQYAPRGAGEGMPSTPEGALLSLAEKLDNLAGCFGAGLVPSGSEDPYGLRRQAVAVFAILAEKGLHLDLRRAVGQALEPYSFPDRETVEGQLQEFLRQRLRHYLLNRGFPYDLVGAVLQSGLDDPADALQRLLALQEAREEGRLGKVYTAFERCYNLSLKGDGRALDEALLREEAERDLHSRAVWAQEPLRERLDAGDHRGALEVLAGLAPAVDALFEKVFIMGEEEALRLNRLALLAEVVALFMEMADFSQLVAEA
jgi:glycyl-tRNA synthetase beta chain